MAYKVLGYLVWRGAKWYLRRSYGRFLPSRKVAAMGLVGAAVAGLLLAGRRQLS